MLNEREKYLSTACNFPQLASRFLKKLATFLKFAYCKLVRHPGVLYIKCYKKHLPAVRKDFVR